MTYNQREKIRIKKFWMYCNECGYQKSDVYFNPPNCPKCRKRLHFLYFTKAQWDSYSDVIAEIGCKLFAKKHMVRGSIINEGFNS